MKNHLKGIFQILISLNLICHSVDVMSQDDSTYITADNSSIQYMGRIDFSNSLEPKFSFPGVTIRAKFNGTWIQAVFNDLGLGGSQTTNYFNIILDGNLLGKIKLKSSDTLYTLASGLADTEHTIELVKRTESSVGSTIFKGFVIGKTELLTPDPLPTYKMEFIGDSWTCGYGNEVSTNSPNTGFNSVNEDNYRTWGYTLAKKFNAQYHATAISGRGLYRNNTGTTHGVLPDEFDKIFPGSATPLWNFENYIPDLVVIQLGTNDLYQETLSTPIMLDSALFVDKYIAFINTIRSKYGNDTKIICAFGSSKSDWWPENLKHLTRWRNYVRAVVKHFNDNSDNKVYKFEQSVQSAPYGEDWHPTLVTHNQVANEMAPFIESITGLEASNYQAPTTTLSIITSNIIPTSKKSLLKFYPNPVVNELSIEGIEEIQQWEIYDNKGILKLTGMGSTGNLSSLQPGLYFIKCGQLYNSVVKF